MITTYNENTIHYHGLSTDKKPILGPNYNGSIFHEMDTSKDYIYDAEKKQWNIVKSSGGGGGGGTTYTAGNGIKISADDVISVDTAKVALKSDVTKVTKSSTNGNIKVNNAEMVVYTLPPAYAEYLDKATYSTPVVTKFQLLNASGNSVAGNYEIGSSVVVSKMKHCETNISNISGKLTFNGMQVTPSATDAIVSLTTAETVTSNKTYTISGTDTKAGSVTKSAAITFTEYAYSCLTASDTAPTTSLVKQSAVSSFEASGASFSYVKDQYLYLYTSGAGKTVKTEVLGQWIDVDSTAMGAVTITQANGAKRSYQCYRVGPFIGSGSAKYKV